MEAKQEFCFTVLGKPETKKRPRIFRNGGRITPSIWYEEMVQEAFVEAYPDSKPIGWSLCYDNENPDEYQWEFIKGTKDKNIPKVKLRCIVYVSSGKIGDLDNYIKSISDALNDYAFVDDRQIKSVQSYLILDPDEEDRVEILVTVYDQRKDKFLKALRSYFRKKSKIIDFREDYYE